MNKNINLLIIILIVIIVIYIIFINYNKTEKFSVICGDEDRTFIDDTITGFCNELCNDPDICGDTAGLNSQQCVSRKKYCVQQCPSFARDKIIKGGRIAGHYITKAIVHNEIYNSQNIEFIGGNWIIVNKNEFIQTVGQDVNNIGLLELDLKNKLNNGQVVFSRQYIDGLQNEINLFSYVDKIDTLDNTISKCFIVNRSITETNTVLGDKFRLENSSLLEANRVVSEQNAIIIKINQALDSIGETASCNVEASPLKWNNMQNNVIGGDYIEHINVELGNKIKEKNGDLLDSDIASLSISNIKYNNVIKVFLDDGNFNYWRPVLPKRLENYIKVGYASVNDYQWGSTINNICTSEHNNYTPIFDGMIKNSNKDKYLADSKTIGTKWKVVEKIPYINTYGGTNNNIYSSDLKNRLNSGELIFEKEYIESLSIQFDAQSYFDMDSDTNKIYVIDFNYMYYSIDDIISERILWNDNVNSAIKSRRNTADFDCAYTKQQISEWGNEITPSDNVGITDIGIFGKLGNVKVLAENQESLIDNPSQYSMISDYITAKNAKDSVITNCFKKNTNKESIVNTEGKIVRNDDKKWIKEVKNTDLQKWENSSYPTDILSKQYIHKDIINSKVSELIENTTNCKYSHEQVRNWKGSTVTDNNKAEIIPNFGSPEGYNYGLLGVDVNNYEPITKYAKLSQDIYDLDNSCAFTINQVKNWDNQNKPIININDQNITYGLIGTEDQEYNNRQTILDNYNNNCAYKKIIPTGQTDSTTFLYKANLEDVGTTIDLNTQDIITTNGNTWGKFDNSLSSLSTIDNIKTNNFPYVNNELLKTSINSICKSSTLDATDNNNRYTSKNDMYGLIGSQDNEYKTSSSCNIKKQQELSDARDNYSSQLSQAYTPITSKFQGYTVSETDKWNKLLENQRKLKAKMSSMKDVCNNNSFQQGQNSDLPKKEKLFYTSIKFIKDDSISLANSILIDNPALSNLLKQAPDSQGVNSFVDSNNIYHISEKALNDLNPKDRFYSFTSTNYIITDNNDKFRLATVNEYMPGLGPKQDIWGNRFSKYKSSKSDAYQTRKNELVDQCNGIGYNWVTADKCSDSNKSCIDTSFKTDNEQKTNIDNATKLGSSWYTSQYTDGQIKAREMISSKNGIYYKLYGSEWLISTDTQYELLGHNYDNDQGTKLGELKLKLIKEETLGNVIDNIITMNYQDIIDLQDLLKWNGYFKVGEKLYIQTNIGENCDECAPFTNKSKYIDGLEQTEADKCSTGVCSPECISCTDSGNSCISNNRIITTEKYAEGIEEVSKLASKYAGEIFLDKYTNGNTCVNYSNVPKGNSLKLKNTCYTDGILDNSKVCSAIPDTTHQTNIDKKVARNQNYRDYCQETESSSYCSPSGIETCDN